MVSRPVITIVGRARAGPVIQKIAELLALHAHAARTFITSDLLSVPGIAETTLLVCFHTPCGAEQMNAMPALQGIISPILGYEWIDTEEATRRGIPVVNGETSENRESMAEATIMLLLALLYRLRETEAELRERTEGGNLQRRMLKGRTVGIIGSGGIARQVIRRLAAWDVDLQVYTRVETPGLAGVRLVSLDELLSTSEVIIVMTRLDSGTRHLLNRERLQRLPRGTFLVNTARGGLIEESALVEALKSGQIAAAALDAFEVEPLALDHPLRKLPNLILTPHAVGHTIEMYESIPRQALENVLLLLRGVLPDSCQNSNVAMRWSAAQQAPPVVSRLGLARLPPG